MATVYVVQRSTKTKGTRYHVRYQAKRRTPAILLGVYDTKQRALIARERALDDLAEGREPSRNVVAVSREGVTVASAAATWLSSVADTLAPRTLKNYRRTIHTLPDWLERADPLTVTHEDVQRFVELLKKRKFARATIEREIVALRSVLDYAGARPNPASDRRVRLPRKNRKAYRLPSQADLAILREALPDRVDLMLLLEHTGLRIQEAASLRWADIDYPRNRLLVQDSKTSAGRRWVEHLPDTPAFPTRGPDQDGDLVFQPSPLSFTAAIWHAHKRRGTPLYSAHDFRHLHASRLLHQQILSPAQIAARLGHANAGVTLGTYSHVVPPD